MKGNKQIHKKVTTVTAYKKDTIINMKLVNPSITLKQISVNLSCSYGYVRKVWSVFIRKQVTTRRSPYLPYNYHGWYKYAKISKIVYEKCPVEISSNRNKQKVWRGRFCTLVFHKKGSLICFPSGADWENEVRNFLVSFVPDGLVHVEAILNKFVDQGKKSFAVHTPNVPKNFNIRVKGIGSFKTDTTPYPDGTTEFEIDPKYDKRLESIERSMLVFARGMDQHMLLIKEIRFLVGSMQKVVDGLKQC